MDYIELPWKGQLLCGTISPFFSGDVREMPIYGRKRDLDMQSTKAAFKLYLETSICLFIYLLCLYVEERECHLLIKY